MSTSPLYLQIKQHIEQKIDSGVWGVGQRISTEFELTDLFNVSRMTVNKAIRDLVNEGKLIRKPRLGTFVCERKSKVESPLLDINNIATEVEQRGKTYSNKVVEQRSIQADEYVATKLGIMLGATVYYSEIIHYENGSPLQVEIRWVNAVHAPNYFEQDFTRMTPNQYLSENCPLSAIEHTVEAITPNAKVTKALNLNQNEPCLLLNRRTWSGDKLVSSAKLYHPGAKYKLRSKVSLL